MSNRDFAYSEVNLSPLVLHSRMLESRCVLKLFIISGNFGLSKFSPKPLREILITKFGSIYFDCKNRIEWVKFFISQSLVMSCLLFSPMFKETILVVLFLHVLLSIHQHRVGFQNLLTTALHL